MLIRSSLRHLWQQRGLTALALLAIGLAVALCVAVWQTNSSAVASFANTSQRLQGSATHVIQAGPQGISHEWYAQQRRSGLFREASPKNRKAQSSYPPRIQKGASAANGRPCWA